jgi:hypothetical protein
MPEASSIATPVEWQRVGRQLERFEREEPLDDVERFLVREFRRYLKEEGLADEGALTAAAAFAFAARPSAERTLARLVEIADASRATAWDAGVKGLAARTPSFFARSWTDRAAICRSSRIPRQFGHRLRGRCLALGRPAARAARAACYRPGERLNLVREPIA